MVDVAHHILDTGGVTQNDVVDNNCHVFVVCCKCGLLSIAKRLVSIGNITAKDVRTTDTKVFRKCCAHGHLLVAEWLVQTFQLSHVDITARNNEAFRTTCTNGHLHVAKWLVEGMQLTADELRACDNEAFRLCCARGHRELAMWFMCILTEEDVYAAGHDALVKSFENGHQDVVELLLSMHYVDVWTRPKLEFVPLFWSACIAHDIGCAEQLVNLFCLGNEHVWSPDVDSAINLLVQHTEDSGIAKWALWHIGLLHINMTHTQKNNNPTLCREGVTIDEDMVINWVVENVGTPSWYVSLSIQRRRSDLVEYFTRINNNLHETQKENNNNNNNNTQKLMDVYHFPCV